MRPSLVAESLKQLYPTRLAVHLEGPPGTAKSSLVWQAASALFDGGTLQSTVGGRPDVPWYRELRGLTIDPVDGRGVPKVIEEDGQFWTTWAPPKDLIPTEGEGIFCIEELPQSAPAVQCMLAELLLDRRMCGKKIGDGWWVVSTGNRASDRAGAGRILSHNASRLIRLPVEVSHDDFHGWALAVGISPKVRSFLKFKPGFLHMFDPAADTSPDPRGWERVSIAVPYLTEATEVEVIGGIVGEGPAAEYVAYQRMYDQLTDPRDILKSPKTATVPKEPAVLHAMCGALTECVRGAKAPTCTALIEYAGRLPEEFGILLVRDCTSINPGVLTVPAAVAWMMKHKDLVLGKAA